MRRQLKLGIAVFVIIAIVLFGFLVPLVPQPAHSSCTVLTHNVTAYSSLSFWLSRGYLGASYSFGDYSFAYPVAPPATRCW
jgi:hypothetical protein